MALKVCIYGTGAIGSLIAGRLAQTNATVSCICRGQQLKIIRNKGILVTDINGNCMRSNAIRAYDDPNQLEPQDIVIVSLKTHALAANAHKIAALLGPNSAVVTAQNGMPWWYFFGDRSNTTLKHLAKVDPDASLWSELKPDRALGSIVYPAAKLIAPGEVQHISGNRFTIGEPDNCHSYRLARLHELLAQAGFEITVAADIREEVWLKLSVNAAINPLTLLRRCTIGAVLKDAQLRQQLVDLIAESQRVARALGIASAMTPADLADVLQVVATHKTSMLVDLEQERRLELDAITGAVIEIAEHLDIAVPTLSATYRQVQRDVLGTYEACS